MSESTNTTDGITEAARAIGTVAREAAAELTRLRQHNDALRAARDKLAREVVERRETTPERTCYEGDRFETLRGLVRAVDADPLCKEGA